MYVLMTRMKQKFLNQVQSKHCLLRAEIAKMCKAVIIFLSNIFSKPKLDYQYLKALTFSLDRYFCIVPEIETKPFAP